MTAYGKDPSCRSEERRYTDKKEIATRESGGTNQINGCRHGGRATQEINDGRFRMNRKAEPLCGDDAARQKIECAI